MKKIFYCSFAAFAFALSSCNPINPKMTWDEFEQTEIVKKQGLEKTDEGLYAKTIQEGNGDECNYLQTLTLDVKFQTVDGQELKGFDGDIKLMDIKEKEADQLAKLVYEMKTGGVKEAYIPSDLAKKAGMLDNTDFPVVKATITLKAIQLPTWDIEIEGKVTKLQMGMSVSKVYELLGTPFDGKREDAIGLVIFQYKDKAKNKIYGLNFENDKLSSVDALQL